MKVRSIKKLYDEAVQILKSADVPDYDLDAKYLMEFALNISRIDMMINPDKEIDIAGQEKYISVINKRATRCPLQYITGTQEFMGIEFKVNESVLIPRQDTEILVEWVMKRSLGKKVLDMCTGSGCIAISLAKLGNVSEITAVDISKQALDVANNNSEINGTDVRFVESDLFENVTGKYDIIVSNPPYIPVKDIEGLMPEVRDYEPKLALEADNKGLDFYEKISREAVNYLNDGGIVAYEIGCEQAEDVKRILLDNGFYDIEVVKDYAGHDRVVTGKYQIIQTVE